MCKDPAFPQGDTESPWRRWNKSAFQNFENNIGRGLFTGKTAILTSCLLCQISTCTETHTLRVTRQDPLIGTHTWSKVDGKMKKAKWKE